MRKSCLIIAAAVAALVLLLVLGSVAIAIFAGHDQKGSNTVTTTPRVTPTEAPQDFPDTPETPDGKTTGISTPPVRYDNPSPTTSYIPDPPPPAYTPQNPQNRLLPTLPNGVRAIASYRARLSERDHRSSTGTRLTLVPDILRQDRANFYRSPRNRDPEDEADPLFADARQRALRFNETPFYGRVRDLIVDGTPYVQVDIYPVGFYVTVLSP